MKRGHILPGIAVVCVIALVSCWLWLRQEQSQPWVLENAPSPPMVPSETEAATTEPMTQEKQQEIAKQRDASIRASIEGSNVPINFWGKVVDQDGRPLNGVVVNYQYQTEHVLLPGVAWARSAVHKGVVTTTGYGIFSIEKLRGHFLSIEGFKKDGYKVPEQFSPAVATFNYFGDTAGGKFSPDKQRPVEFVMLSEGSVPQLIVLGGDFGNGMRIPADGTPERWNLWTGRKDSNGELQVTFRREPAVLSNTGEPPLWEAKLEMIGGGIMEAARDRSLWQAPEGGYVGTIDYPKTEQKRGTRRRAFYVKTADDKYGRIELELFPRDEGATVRCLIKSQMNPKPGSRTLAR